MSSVRCPASRIRSCWRARTARVGARAAAGARVCLGAGARTLRAPRDGLCPTGCGRRRREQHGSAPCEEAGPGERLCCGSCHRCSRWCASSRRSWRPRTTRGAGARRCVFRLTPPFATSSVANAAVVPLPCRTRPAHGWRCSTLLRGQSFPSSSWPRQAKVRQLPAATDVDVPKCLVQRARRPLPSCLTRRVCESTTSRR